MARLPVGERILIQQRILRLLYRHPFGLTEREIAAELGLHRRRLNNYLRALRAQQQVYKEGRYWFAG